MYFLKEKVKFGIQSIYLIKWSTYLCHIFLVTGLRNRRFHDFRDVGKIQRLVPHMPNLDTGRCV